MALDLNLRQHLVDLVDNVGFYADMRQWAALRALYAGEIELDYSSLVGGGPITINADDLIGAWTVGLAKYIATQHMTSNHGVTQEGDRATVIAYVQATHWLPNEGGDPTWTTHGYYNYQLRQSEQGWKITHHQFSATMVYGSKTLLEMQGVKTEWISVGGK